MDLSLCRSLLYMANISCKHFVGDIAPYRLKFTQQRSALDAHLLFRTEKYQNLDKINKEETLNYD